MIIKCCILRKPAIKKRICRILSILVLVIQSNFNVYLMLRKSEVIVQNKRKFSRISFKSLVRLERSGASYTGILLDICLKGALVSVDELGFKGEKGDKFLFLLHLPDSNIDLQFSSILVHKENSHCGLQFAETDIESMTHLRNLIELNLGDPEQVSEELSFLIN